MSHESVLQEIKDDLQEYATSELYLSKNNIEKNTYDLSLTTDLET